MGRHQWSIWLENRNMFIGDLCCDCPCGLEFRDILHWVGVSGRAKPNDLMSVAYAWRDVCRRSATLRGTNDATRVSSTLFLFMIRVARVERVVDSSLCVGERGGGDFGMIGGQQIKWCTTHTRLRCTF